MILEADSTRAFAHPFTGRLDATLGADLLVVDGTGWKSQYPY